MDRDCGWSCHSRDLEFRGSVIEQDRGAGNACTMGAQLWRADRSDEAGRILNERGRMTPEEHIEKMKKAIAQAIKVMGDRFGSTEQDVSRAIQELKVSMQGSSEPRLPVEPVSRPGHQSAQGV